MTGTRVEPDDNDIVVWKFDDAGAPFVNSSTSPSAPSHAVSDLANISGTINLRQPSPFAASGTNSCVQFTGINSSSPRNTIYGANAVIPQAPVTFSTWLYIRTYNYTGLTQHFFSKQHTTGTWGGVFAQVGCQNRQYTSQSTAFDLFLASATGSDIVLDAGNNIPINRWCHVGLVYDGANKYGYLNGNLVGQQAATGSINYGNSGPWFFGAIPAGGSPEEGQYSICDFRIANVARPQSYFQNIYRNAMSSLGNPEVTYYKLRAYDLSCSTPTPVYWISSILDYTDAPAAPCGSLGPIEILESWNVLGI